jgi:GT2 family glycosyltransferase
MKKVGVLLAAHNRVDNTISCLKSFYQECSRVNKTFDIYLLDDGSVDGTKQIIEQFDSSITILDGTGNLYWNGGMRLAWQYAVSIKEYDCFLWINDDVTFIKGALYQLFRDFDSFDNYKSRPIIVGSCKSRITGDQTYGGRTDRGWVEPNEVLQKCKYINGNIVLVHKTTYERIGLLSKRYTHALGDFDYGLRALQVGIYSLVSSEYIGFCETNDTPVWMNADVTFRKRLRHFHSPNGLSPWEYYYFLFYHYGTGNAVLRILKSLLCLLAPRIYRRLKSH